LPRRLTWGIVFSGFEQVFKNGNLALPQISGDCAKIPIFGINMGKLGQWQQWQLPGKPSVFPGEMGKEGKERCRRETGEASANMG